MIDDVLVIGYGNPLRSDDGIGRYATERLAADPRLDGVTVIGRHQLTPELALDISRATFVVFVDAGQGLTAGAYTIDAMRPTDENGRGWSHHLAPSGLVDLARELYGAVPDVAIVKVGVASLAIGDRLSPVVESALPRLVDSVAELIAAHAARRRTTTGVNRHA